MGLKIQMAGLRNLKSEMDRLWTKMGGVANLERFLWAGKLFAHPDLHLWFHRDFKWWGCRRLIKNGESRGILCLRFGWLVATIRC